MVRMRTWGPVWVLAAVVTVGCGPRSGHKDERNDAGSDPTTSGAETDPSTTADPGDDPPVPDPEEDPDADPPPPPDGDTDDSGGSVFVEVPDGGVPPECDAWSQDCPDGFKCTPWANDGGNSWNATTCTEIAENPGQPGDPCTVADGPASGVDDCDLGSMCWAVDPDTGTGYCASLCQGDPQQSTCPDPESTCGVYGDGILILCYRICNPLAPDCVSDRETCTQSPWTQRFHCVPESSGGAGLYGDPCTYVASCDRGLWCAPSIHVPGCTDVGCCTNFCDVPLGDDQCGGSPDGQRCIAWYEPGEAPDPELANVGFCGVPS